MYILNKYFLFNNLKYSYYALIAITLQRTFHFTIHFPLSSPVIEQVYPV